ncbi:Cmx/CmrA family chloramphenicol efflux MFS transporter [Streptomyces marincola]|uniref:MFS transporter n=1 Tax=Streptomyces marincola TaxID=2878388 RepID=A0A1W7D5X9_9ACTN|nr:Cmx/CmrA family chloramphenicol efflux MFS transporter [Streptomyces marincola]ARQ72394.1 MFS transporter [Streptomyces marincola]
MPLAVYILGAAVFALGTSEFMLSGLLPEVADDLDVSIPSAGLLISAFAIGMVVGAPVLAAATQRLPRRTTLVGLLAVFTAGHVVGALAPGYGVLFVCRVVSAVACAGFWAVGAAVAISLVPPQARARTMAVMLGGLSIANIAGVPGGAALGQSLGWRSAFWAVALMSAVALVGLLLFVPRTSPQDIAAHRPALRTELRVYRDPQVWLAMTTTALFAAGTFCFFSYLAPLLTDVAGLDEGWVPAVLVLYGIGALIGTVVGGRLADTHMFGTLYAGLGSAIVVLVLIALTAEYAPAVIVLSGLFGLGAFLCSPGLNARIFEVAAGAPTLAGATTTSSFNTGNTIGPWAGGLVIGGGLGYAWTAWLGALLVVAALGGAWLQSRAVQRAGRPARPVAGGADAAPRDAGRPAGAPESTGVPEGTHAGER